MYGCLLIQKDQCDALLKSWVGYSIWYMNMHLHMTSLPWWVGKEAVLSEEIEQFPSLICLSFHSNAHFLVIFKELFSLTVAMVPIPSISLGKLSMAAVQCPSSHVNTHTQSGEACHYTYSHMPIHIQIRNWGLPEYWSEKEKQKNITWDCLTNGNIMHVFQIPQGCTISQEFGTRTKPLPQC